MAPRHRARLSRSTLNLVLTAALAHFLALSFTSCAPAELQPEESPGQSTSIESPPSAQVSPTFDVQAIIRRVSQAFRSERGSFIGGQQTFAVRVDTDGTVHFSPRQAQGEQQPPVLGEPLKLRTASLTRGARSLLQEARASVREDGTLALARGPVVEVLQNSDEGLEQRWELVSKPEGHGDLEVRVELSGLEYAGQTETGHHYVDPRTGLGVRYGKATWVDANGVRTAVEPVREGEALVMRVPADVLEDSAYPAVLDPLVSPESGIDTPPYRPTTGAQYTPSIAFGNGVYLVAWVDLLTGFEAIYGTRVRASDGVVLDPRGIVISTNLGAKYRSAIAFDGTNFLVVWDDGRNRNMDIYAARVRASDGVVLEPNGIAIYRGTGEQTSPAVAFDGTQYLVVWQDARFSGVNGDDIFGARVRASDGVVLDTTSLSISVRANDQTRPVVAFGGGSFLVVWEDSRNGPFGDLFATRVRPSDGAVLDTTNGFVLTTATGVQSQPSIVFDGTNHFVVWADYRSGNSDIYGARVRPSDRSVLDPTGIALITATGGPSLPRVTLAGDTYFVVWQDSRTGTGSDIYGTRVRVSDRTVLDPSGLPISVGPKGETSPAVASDGESVLVAWTDNRSAGMSDIYGTRVRVEDGVLLDGTGVALSTHIASQSNPAIAAYGDGYLVVWSEGQGISGSDDIYGARVRGSDGALLDPAGILISTRSTSERMPVVAFNGTNFLVVWQDYRGGTASDLYGTRVRASDGVVLDPDGLVISSGAQNQDQPSVASNGSNYLVVWKDTRNNSAGDIYGTLVRASDGSRLAMDVPISNDTAWYDDSPEVASDGVDYLVVWRYLQSTGVIKGARVSGSTGAVLPSEILISAGGPPASSPAVAYGGGVYLVTWTGTPTSQDGNIYAARVRALDGAVLDTSSIPVCTRTGNQSGAEVAFDGGHFLVVWVDTQNSPGTRVSLEGTVVDGPGFVITAGLPRPGWRRMPQAVSWVSSPGWIPSWESSERGQSSSPLAPTERPVPRRPIAAVASAWTASAATVRVRRGRVAGASVKSCPLRSPALGTWRPRPAVPRVPSSATHRPVPREVSRSR